MPVLFNRHGRDRHNEYHERGHSNVRPIKPASASTAAVLVAGRLVAELLLIHAPVSLARDRVCEAPPVLGHHQLGLLFAKETEHNKVGHHVQLARSGGHLSRAMLYEQEERPYAAMCRGPRVIGSCWMRRPARWPVRTSTHGPKEGYKAIDQVFDLDYGRLVG